MGAVRIKRSAGAPAKSFSRMAPTAPKLPAMVAPVSAFKRAASAATRPCAAPPLKRVRYMGFSAHRGDQALARDRQVAHAHAKGVKDGIADRRRRRAVRRLAGAKRPFGGAGEDLDLDGGHLREAQDGVVLPAVAGNALGIEAHRLEEGPARRLNGATLDLIDNAVGIDDLADVDGGHQTPDPDFGAGFDFGHHRAVGAKILVAGKADAVAGRLALRPGTPIGARGGGLEHG